MLRAGDYFLFKLENAQLLAHLFVKYCEARLISWSSPAFGKAINGSRRPDLKIFYRPFTGQNPAAT
jgi:hypothetical protein